MKKSIIIIAALIILAATAWFIFFRKSPEAKIKEAIFAANYCEATSDCQVVQSQCPFDCYVVVHKNEATRIEVMIQSYRSQCIYSCVELKGVECNSGKCEILR